MLLYDNRARLRILCQFYGSIYRRVYVALFIFACYSTGLYFLKKHFKDDFIFVVDNPMAVQAMAYLIAFTITFRTTIAWQRFWEACRELMFMYSKWCDAYSQLLGFITSTEKIKENHDIKRLEHARLEISHFFSLLSAVAVERLMRGDIRRMEVRRRKGVAWESQVATRASMRKTDLTGAKNLFPRRVLMINHGQSLVSEDVEIGEDNGDGKDKPFHKNTRGGSVRWMSVITAPHKSFRLLSEWSAATGELGFFNSSSMGSAEDPWETPLSIVGEVSTEELRHLRASKDRVGLLLVWIYELVANLTPHLHIAPPIVSRVFQELSNGALGYSQAEKLTDIPFPFVFAQLMAVAMIFIITVWPICFVLVTGNSWFAPFLSASVVSTFWTLNELAKELENPFGKEANNVPLLDAHERFIEFLTEMHGLCLPRDRDFFTPPIPPEPGAETACDIASESVTIEAARGHSKGAAGFDLEQAEPEMEPEMEPWVAEASYACRTENSLFGPSQEDSKSISSARTQLIC